MTDKIYKKQVGGTHYKSMVIQPSEFINRNNIPFAEGNAIKYLCRHKQKNQKQDLEKAIHYCQNHRVIPTLSCGMNPEIAQRSECEEPFNKSS